MNNFGYSSTGYCGDNFASTLNMLFNNVNGINIFNYDDYGYGSYGYGGCCANNKSYWGWQAGLAAFNVAITVVTGWFSNRRAAKAEEKAQFAKNETAFNDALKTLGINKTPEELTVADIDGAQLEGKYEDAIKTIKDKIGDASTGLTKEYNDAKADLTKAESNLEATGDKLDELRGKLDPSNADSDEQKKLKSEIEALEKTEEQQEKAVAKAKAKLEEKEAALDKATAELKKAEQERDIALENHKEAQRIAKEYLPEMQAKAKEAREAREKQEAKAAKKAARAEKREDRRNSNWFDLADGNDKTIDDKVDAYKNKFYSPDDNGNLVYEIYGFEPEDGKDKTVTLDDLEAIAHLCSKARKGSDEEKKLLKDQFRLAIESYPDQNNIPRRIERVWEEIVSKWPEMD